jgi:hypothetical protein
LAANRTPEVPKDTKASPARTTPTPTPEAARAFLTPDLLQRWLAGARSLRWQRAQA